MFKRDKRSYSRLVSSDKVPPAEASMLQSISYIFSLNKVMIIVCLACWTMISFLSGFFIGMIPDSHPVSTLSELGLPLSTVNKTFIYNRTFAEVPSNSTNKAWEDLFPPDGGFFNVTELGAQRSTMSVFHQLHCLDGIRRGYWELFLTTQSILSPGNSSMAGMGMHSPSHIRHCIDLLRQSLMCNIDTTMELKEEGANGVHGFGIEHQCKDWDHLLSVVGERQSRHHQI